mmetsp:Transcript_8467/g.16488  ORF Transcript_8467/g.16488 Transcript_8467/m.16488 type:complete len:265 (+) Transcript_8467:519-1313(+)
MIQKGSLPHNSRFHSVWKVAALLDSMFVQLLNKSVNISSIYVHLLGSQVRLSGHECCESPHIFFRLGSLHGNQCVDLLRKLGRLVLRPLNTRHHAGPHRGPHHAWAQSVHSHTNGSQLQCQTLGKTNAGKIGRHVIRNSGLSDLSCNGRHNDNRPCVKGLLPFICFLTFLKSFPEMRDDGLRQIKIRPHVCVKDVIPLLLRCVFHFQERSLYPRIVHQNIHTSKTLQCRLNQCLATVLVAHIALHTLNLGLVCSFLVVLLCGLL